MIQQDFQGVLNEVLNIHIAKNHDYGDSFHILFEKIGMPYAYGHMAEKLERVWTLMNSDAKVKSESVRDSLLDLIGYAAMTVVEMSKSETHWIVNTTEQ